MSPAVRRGLLVVFAVSAIGIGVWCYFAPAHWYATFPGFGLTWLPVLGPFNEHLVADVGAFYLGFGVLSLVAARRPADTVLAGWGWVVFSVLHLVYHLRHLHMYSLRDQVLNVVVLSLFVVMGAALLVPQRKRA
ncbi:hypothetical protein [Actinokineospora pegani]|uniref:hypothetical protein n=1 Tax=Actinokineospora pegani TaxID=2654637 RepID=UPI0012E9E350|nr:hypothetical protein [Actinokineospora pegani]